jgi:hypothetical protein
LNGLGPTTGYAGFSSSLLEGFYGRVFYTDSSGFAGFCIGTVIVFAPLPAFELEAVVGRLVFYTALLCAFLSSGFLFAQWLAKYCLN